MENPYHPPESTHRQDLPGADDSTLRLQVRLGKDDRTPGVSPIGTTFPRHMAALMDNVFALIFAVVVAQQLPEDWLIGQGITFLLAYFAYHTVWELLMSTTPGKLLMGLKILSYDGTKCTKKQVLIRSAVRLLEVNPLLFAGLPAAARIVLSRDKQRFGDKLADTIVVFSKSAKRKLDN